MLFPDVFLQKPVMTVLSCVKRLLWKACALLKSMSSGTPMTAGL